MADTRRLPGAQITYWDWQLAAACRGMASATFFHPPNERGEEREARINNAKTICRTCPVADECLTHALAIPEPYGTWGGLSEDERADRLGVQSLRYPARIVPAVNQSTAEPPRRAESQESPINDTSFTGRHLRKV